LLHVQFEGTLPEALRHLRDLGASLSYALLADSLEAKHKLTPFYRVCAEILYLDSNQFSGTLPGSLLSSLLVLRKYLGEHHFQTVGE